MACFLEHRWPPRTKNISAAKWGATCEKELLHIKQRVGRLFQTAKIFLGKIEKSSGLSHLAQGTEPAPKGKACHGEDAGSGCSRAGAGA
jgi:hypothetical protein